MQKEEIIKRLTEIKGQVTALGHEHLKDKMPIEIDRLRFEFAPFICLEKSFDAAINKLKKKKA